MTRLFYDYYFETSVTVIYKKINAKASLCGRVVSVPEQQTEFLIGSFCINSPGLLREIFSFFYDWFILPGRTNLHLSGCQIKNNYGVEPHVQITKTFKDPCLLNYVQGAISCRKEQLYCSHRREKTFVIWLTSMSHCCKCIILYLKSAEHLHDSIQIHSNNTNLIYTQAKQSW